MTDPVYPFWGIILVGIYGGTFYWGIDQVNVQRMLGAKSLDHARWGAMFAILLKLTPAFIFALPGVIVLAINPHLAEPRDAFVTILTICCRRESAATCFRRWWERSFRR